LPGRHFARPAAAKRARRLAPAQALHHRPALDGRAVHDVRNRRPNILRFTYGVHVFWAGRQRLFQRQPPRPFRLLFAQTAVRAAATARAAAAQTVRWRGVGGVWETPQEYTAVRARAHHGPAVRTHFYVGYDARVPDTDMRGYPLVVQPDLNCLIRTAGHDVLSCA